ncbi:MAG: hypothetical protein K6G12_04755 [Lachnospiraceae bacterium]|nr:hypothetical protein [Lachnospiraceae bacterium]
MTSLVMAKQMIKRFYSKYEAYVLPVIKFLISMICLLIINGRLGYMSQLNNFVIVLMVSLMCSFMPLNFTVFIAAMFVLGHMYKLSLECFLVVGALFLILFLLYFRFSPNDTIAVLLTPICFILKIPYVMPIAAGLLGGPSSAVSVGCGVIVYYVLEALIVGAGSINSLADEEMTTRLKFVIDTVLNNKPMLAMVCAFAITIIIVYIVKRLRVYYAWSIAIGVGVVADIVLILIFDLIFDTHISGGGLILGSLVALIVGAVLQFLFFHVDYSRTEKLQFEDDEYYYYVKAVPKVTVSNTQKRVKKINSSKKKEQ